ncbi:hypothetical protein R1flu_010179 [Riccia fluitans]|uniref:Uncharacterized protein n=1 Tax=Riccia fluitans TaxID=41844 RepID=A0ABD1Z795_9MARC
MRHTSIRQKGRKNPKSDRTVEQQCGGRVDRRRWLLERALCLSWANSKSPGLFLAAQQKSSSSSLLTLFEQSSASYVGRLKLFSFYHIFLPSIVPFAVSAAFN